jgi:hypothetical protein
MIVVVPRDARLPGTFFEGISDPVVYEDDDGSYLCPSCSERFRILFRVPVSVN